jgi:EmrB/QacA subfamily drug resistance transporter
MTPTGALTARTEHRTPSPMILVVCCVAWFMVVLDVSIVTVALPHMRASLHLSATGVQWIVNAYTLTFAGFLLLGGRAADLFGRRRAFLFGLIVFTVSSLVGGLAQSGGWLVAARAVQGVGGAVLAPSTLTLLTTTFIDPDERRRALGVWSASGASGVAVGVLAGGLLTDLLSWRWVLFVNVPVGIVLLGVALITVTESKAKYSDQRLDLAGAITITAGLAVLVYGIVGTSNHAWGSATTILTLAVAVVLIAAFIVIEARYARHPIVPLSVFRRRSLSTANALAVTYGAAQYGMYIFFSLYLQEVNHYSPLKAGLAFLAPALATATASLCAARTVARLGIRRQLVLGMTLTAGGIFWLSQLTAGAGYAGHMLIPLVLAGFGFGMSMVPLTMSATADMPSSQAGLASGLINTSRQIGGSIGLAAMTTVAAALAAHGHRAPTATSLTTGYDRAFLISAATLIVGVGVATLLPSAARRGAGRTRDVRLTRPVRESEVPARRQPWPRRMLPAGQKERAGRHNF